MQEIFGNQRMYELRPLPDATWEDWSKFKRPEENYGLADFNLNDLYFEFDPIQIHKEVMYWVTSKYPSCDLNWHSNKLVGCSTSNFPMYYETFLKLSWLTKVYLKESFKYPMGLIWFPHSKGIDEGNWWIHPGGGRQKVVAMFGDRDQTMEFLTFNTYGKPVKFKRVFEREEEFKDYFNAPYGIAYVADKGTLIPHCLFNSVQNNTSLRDPLEAYLDLIHKYKIDINGKPITSFGDKKLNVVSAEDPESELRALVLLPFYELYNESDYRKYNIQIIT
jgi:hypothetical protein